MFWMVWLNCETRQWDELFAHHGASALCDEAAHPLGRDLAEVVVRGDGVHLLAVLLHHPGNQRGELLLGHGARDEDVGVAHTPFVLVVVPIELCEAIHDRPDGFARGGRECAEHDVRLVLLDQTPRHFLESRVVRLRVVVNQPDRPAQNAAGGVDFPDRQLDCPNLGNNRDGKVAGFILQQTERDWIRGGRRRAGH